ncbi:MAG: hypothetical protein WA632_00140 [Gallionella sp.]
MRSLHKLAHVRADPISVIIDPALDIRNSFGIAPARGGPWLYGAFAPTVNAQRVEM